MLSALIIVFREVLEAALVIGVVAAAIEGLPGRGRWVAAGVGLGVLGAALVASAIGAISEFAHGTGQEPFGAGVLAAAGLMLAWHSIWLFAGLSRIPLKRLLQVTGVIILLIASGMVARAMELLVQAGYVPPLVPRLWDSSALLSGDSILGRSLAARVGYTPAPSLMQVLAWFSSFALIGGLMLARGERFVAKRADAAG